MIGKKDTMAIFESYQNYLKEQNNNFSDLITIADALARAQMNGIISDDDQMKLSNFLRKPEIVKAYDAFKLPPMQMVAGSGGADTTAQSQGDASAVNMGKGGVLEVQPDGQYPQ